MPPDPASFTEWLVKVRRDLSAATILLNAEQDALDIVGFHCQQTANDILAEVERLLNPADPG